MTAMRAMVCGTIEPFFAVPVPHDLQDLARDWFAAHADLGVMVLLPGEALFAEGHRADDFTTHLGAAWTVPED